MKKRNLNSLNLRAWALMIAVFVVGFGILIYRLFTIQIVDGQMYHSRALKQRTSSVTLEAKRGSILDRNEKVLAQSAVVWNVCISPAEIKEEQWAPIATKLSEILEIPEENILKYRGDTESFYARVKLGVDNRTREKVVDFIANSEMNLRCIFFEEAPKRYYTYESLASTILGFTDYDHHGAYGLESYYDSVLSGTPGIDITAKDVRTANSESQKFKAQDGNSLVLTIDEQVQSVLEKHLEIAIAEHKVRKKGAAVVMNIKTGEILGMATKPDFNPNEPYKLQDPNDAEILEAMLESDPAYAETKQDLLYNQWRNKAISDPYEPGSVYKIVTASIALEEQKSFLNDSFYCSGSVKVADRTMNCWWKAGHGYQDFYGIMRNSCNPAFVELGRRIGLTTTRKYMSDFGFGQITGIDLPGEAEGILHDSLGGEVQLASTSFGQSFKATAVQMIVATSAAVNDGKLVQPYIVRQIVDSQGNVVETIQPEVKRQVISAETSAKVRELVEEVVTNGSGRNAAVPGYRIGGKTGTSEKLDEKDRVYVLSFAGFAPMDDPTYACLVILDEPVLNDPYASVIAAPVVGAIFQEILPYLGVEPVYNPGTSGGKMVKVPYLIDYKPHDAQAQLTSLGLKTRMVGQGQNVVRQIPLTGEEISTGGMVTIYCSEDELDTNIALPDFTGIPAVQARATLYEMGLNVKLDGLVTDSTAIVGTQWPLAGEIVTTADSIVLTLVRDTSKDNIEELKKIEDDSSTAGDTSSDKGGADLSAPSGGQTAQQQDFADMPDTSAPVKKSPSGGQSQAEQTPEKPKTEAKNPADTKPNDTEDGLLPDLDI